MRGAERLVSTLIAAATLIACSRGSEGNLLAGRTPSAVTYAREVQRMTDGVSARAGSPWNSELCGTMEAGGGVTWDLGRVRRVGRAFIVADHNDVYTLFVSKDGRRWTRAWEAQPVAGGGLRARAVDDLQLSARYVRLEPRGGDLFYTVAELVVAGPGQQPWPPVLDERDGSITADATTPNLERRMLFALALALLLLVPWTFGSVARRAPAFAPWLCAALLGVYVFAAALSYAHEFRFNLVDDAYISLHYAKNWASGNGLVFNLGERVEGYTNFLWIALCAPFWWLSGGDSMLFARASIGLAIGLAALSLLLVFAIARRVFGGSTLPALFAAAWLAFEDTYVATAAMFALENQLLAVLLLSGLALYVYRPRGYEIALGLTFALAAMTRPDALLWPFAFGVVQVARLLWRARFAATPDTTAGDAPDPAPSWRALLLTAAGFAVPFAIYFAARFAYFGDPLPNTFYLKVGHDLAGAKRGLGYLEGYVVQRHGAPLLVLAAPLLTRAAWARWVSLYVLLHLAYVVYVGGDFYAGHRFLLALTPLFGLLAAAGLDRLLRVRYVRLARGAALAIALAALLALQFGSLRHGPYTSELHRYAPIVDANVQFMRWLKLVGRPSPSIVLGDIGAAGLFGDLRVKDVYGVVDRELARRKVEGFGTGKAGHEKIASVEERIAAQPTYFKWDYVQSEASPAGYYLFNDFPRELRIEGIWVKDDLAIGRVLREPVLSLERRSLERWTRSGDAFANAPSRGKVGTQLKVQGQRGTYINSFHERMGDAARGRLLSPPFTLTGDRMRLLVGGGRDAERLRVSLLIAGRRVFSETGNDFEVLGRREWDIAGLRGQRAEIEIVDDDAGAWGHILVDDIVQWSGQPNATGKL